ncbi:CCHC-type domain-containing protein [Trichonephila clavipes]|nr:CCHC-type domain-containing protein [Trichonephila clavipes]
MGGINMPENQKIWHLMKGVAEDLYQIVTCINEGPSDLESSIREEVRSNLTPLTREKPSPSPYRTERTGERFWRPRTRPRQKK